MTGATKSLRPFFTYFGGKWRAAPHYPAPRFDSIVEPFAGSAGYSLRYPDRQVTLYDADPIITGVWSYLIGASEREILTLPDLEAGQSINDLNIPQEARWLIGFWLNKGVERPMQTPSAWMRGGTHRDSFWGSAIRKRIASQVAHIRHWSVVNASYVDSHRRTATWFVDPPYQTAGTRYRFGSDRVDFTALGEWCRSLTGQVIVCENEGADWLPFEPFRSIKATAGSKRTGVSKEVIWLNDASEQVCAA